MVGWRAWHRAVSREGLSSKGVESSGSGDCRGCYWRRRSCEGTKSSRHDMRRLKPMHRYLCIVTTSPCHDTHSGTLARQPRFELLHEEASIHHEYPCSWAPPCQRPPKTAPIWDITGLGPGRGFPFSRAPGFGLRLPLRRLIRAGPCQPTQPYKWYRSRSTRPDSEHLGHSSYDWAPFLFA